MCLRYVNDRLEVIEVFLGLYNPPGTTGETLASMIKDALLRLNLPIENLRAQTYDGAANMTGKIQWLSGSHTKGIFQGLICPLYVPHIV